MAAPRPGFAAHRGVVRVLLALAPIWLIGILDRGLWTPDEPREADIAWRMSQQTDWTLPQLAGSPFLEKPPLSYWMSADALRFLGDSAAAARVVPERRWAAAIMLVAGAGVFASVFAALPVAALVPLSALWCLVVAWFSLAGTSPMGFTVIASLVKAGTVFLIVWAVVEPGSAVGIRSGLYWIPLGLLNMGTGLWFLGVIRHRVR